MLFIDNIYRYVQAGSEVSALLGRMPSAVGYQPTLANELGMLQERITTTKDASITSIQAVYVPADDLTDPAPAAIFDHLDATTVLSRAVVEQGIYPAIDPLPRRPHPLPPKSWASDITGWPAGRRRRCKGTKKYRISSPFSAWTSFRTRTKSQFTGQERLSASSRSPSS